MRTFGYLEKHSKRISPDTYTIREDNKFVKQIIKLLKRMGVINNQVTTDVTYKRFEIDFDDVVKAIFENRECVRQITSKQGKYLIVGLDYYHKIIKGDFQGYLELGFPDGFNPRITPPSMQTTFIGLQIIMVPWIDGFFVLPELE